MNQINKTIYNLSEEDIKKAIIRYMGMNLLITIRPEEISFTIDIDSIEKFGVISAKVEKQINK